MRLGRRAVLLGTAVAACSRKERAPTSAPTSATPPLAPDAGPVRGATRVVTMSFDEEGTAAVIVPAWGAVGARFPVVVALHGRGEALKGKDRGGFGWPQDYALPRAIERICAPPLTLEDYEGFAEPEQLAKMNGDLAGRPFEGLIIACPYLPDLDLRSDAPAKAYGRWITGSFLPRVRRETPALEGPDSTGIDGVSLGGATALRVGFAFPEHFGTVGGLQPAVYADDAQAWTELARAARAKRPSFLLRILTSHDDYYNGAITRMSRAWNDGGVAHTFLDVVGPHDYSFNRGPGAYELLAWHDRALKRV
jgi:hypothetical protein